MKKTVVAICLIMLTAGMAAGCVDEPEAKAEPVALIQKAPEAPPLPLNQILAANAAALSFAAEPRDFLEGDKFLAFVQDAKERDAAEEEKVKAQALQAAVDQAQATLNSQTPVASGPQPAAMPAAPQPASGGSSSGGSTPQTPAPVRYYNTAAGYSIEFPADWTKVETTLNGAQFIVSLSGPDGEGDKFAENIGVAVEELPLSISSDEYLDLIVAGLKKTMTDFKEIERSDFTLDGKDGKKLVFSYTLNGQTLEDSFYSVVDGLKAYVIIGTAQAEQYSKYSGVFDTSAGSFKFESSQ